MWIESPSQILQLSLTLSAVTIAPLFLCMTTSFTRILVTLSFLRQGMGMVPPTVITGLSLFLTLFSMQEVFIRAYKEGYQPMLQEGVTYQEGLKKISIPFKEFMQKQVSPRELKFMTKLFKTEKNQGWEREFATLAPAFVLSEMKKGFEQGFLLLLPFLVIDLLVASLLLSMGMIMVQPNTIALPLKIAFFVFVDGWIMVTKLALLGPGQV